MTEHVRQECDKRCGSCNICNLFCCAVCGGFEGSLPTECPMGEDRGDEVYAGKIDFIDGKWKAQKVRWMQLQEEAIRRAGKLRTGLP